jgi:hypothetical protein
LCGVWSNPFRMRRNYANALKPNQNKSISCLDIPAYLWFISYLSESEMISKSVSLHFPPGFGHVTHGAEL